MGRRAGKKAGPLSGSETGVVRKRWRDQIKVALVFPNRYPVGMANLGFQTLYGLFNAYDDLLCERAFLPESPDTPLSSCESGRSLDRFDIIAFSVSFENDYPNLIRILDLAGLPRQARDRTPLHPLVLAGGVACWLNPEPIAPFVDLFLLGEAEGLLPDFIAHLDLRRDRPALLRHLARSVSGVYVPSLYRPHYSAEGLLTAFEPQEEVPARVRRVQAPDLTRSIACTQIMAPHGPFQDTYLIEVSRGCPHGCRFCAAGFVYRPPRFQTLVTLCDFLQQACTRAARVGLVGAAVSDLPELTELCNAAARLDLPLAFSSLRADALTPALVAALRRSRIKTATIAPDAGSQRLRNAINKGISEEQVLQAADTLVGAGIPNLKLYFMVGLPTETEEDVAAIVSLIQAVKNRFLAASRLRGRMGRITVSVSVFVPKPWTPFQWAPMADPRAIATKLHHLRQALKGVSNLRLQAETPRQAYIQALLSRGDRRVSSLLEGHAGGQAWNDLFKKAVPHPDHFVLRPRPLDERLPWDFIDHGLNRAYLAAEYARALKDQPSPPCRPEAGCRLCGACNPRTGIPPSSVPEQPLPLRQT